MDELSEDDKLVVYRARKIQRFLHNLSTLREVFTGSPGKYVPIRETIQSFKAILNGEYDDLPEQAFYMKGGIEEVVAAAKNYAVNFQSNPVNLNYINRVLST